MRVRFAIALVSVIVAAGIPAGAAPGSNARTLPTSPQGWSSASQVREPEPGLFDEPVTLGSLRAFLDRRLTTPVDEGGAGARSVRAIVEDQRARAGADDDRFAYVSPAGDLDGDGGIALYTFEGSYAGDTLQLIARDGSDGTVLWARELAWDSFYWTVDLTGDGVGELVSFSYEIVSPTPYVALNATVHQLVSVVSTVDGSDLWEWSRDGDLTFIGAGALVAGAQIWSVSGIVNWIAAESDVSGDAAPDLFIELIDFDEVWGYAAVRGVDVYQTRTTALSLDGANGDEVETFSVDGLQMFTTFQPVPDVSGDGLGDLVGLTVDGQGVTLTMYGADGVVHWADQQARATDYAYVVPAPLVGSSDLVLFTEEYSDDYYLTVQGIAGGDGSSLWSRDLDRTSISFAGDIDGNGGLDFLARGFGYVADPEEYYLTLSGFSGATGEDLWGPLEVHSTPSEGTVGDVFYCWCEPDLDGDGVTDLLVAPARIEIIDDTWYGSYEIEAAHAISGRDGTGIWSRSFGVDFPVQVDVDSDITGNGTDDLFTYEVTGAAGSRVMDVHLLEGSTADAAWDATWDKIPRGFWSYWFGADVDGDGAAELVMNVEGHPRNKPAWYGFLVYDASGIVYGVRTV